MKLPNKLRGRLVTFIIGVSVTSTIGYELIHGWYMTRTINLFRGVLFAMSLSVLLAALLVRVDE